MDKKEFEAIVRAYEQFCNGFKNPPATEILHNNGARQDASLSSAWEGYNFEFACLATIRRRLAFREQEKKITSLRDKLNGDQSRELKNRLLKISCTNGHKQEVVASVLKVSKAMGFIHEPESAQS